MSSALRTSMSYRNGRELHHVTVWQVISDSIIMAILIAIVVYLENFAQPFIGGYSCADTTLTQTIRLSTVPTVLLYTGGAFIALVIVTLVETHRAWREKRHTNPFNPPTYPMFEFQSWPIHRLIVRFYWLFGMLAFGALSSVMITDVMKMTIGRPRPAFFAECQPPQEDLDTCNFDPKAVITNVQCTRNVTDFGGLFQSMPSGHTSFAVFMATWLIIYTQYRIVWHICGSRLYVTAVDLLLALLAVVISISRVRDHKHHWDDVIVGGIVGLVLGLAFAFNVTRLHSTDKTADYSTITPANTQNTSTGEASGHNYGSVRNSVTTAELIHTTTTSGRLSRFSSDEEFYYRPNGQVKK